MWLRMYVVVVAPPGTATAARQPEAPDGGGNHGPRPRRCRRPICLNCVSFWPVRQYTLNSLHCVPLRSVQAQLHLSRGRGIGYTCLEGAGSGIRATGVHAIRVFKVHLAGVF